METYNIAIGEDESQAFQVGIFPDSNQSSCRYRVFRNGKMVASLSPNSQGFLDICQNPGRISDELLDKFSEAIELRHPERLDDESDD